MKGLRHSKPPGYSAELAFIMVNMLMLKFYSERFFDAMSFFNICVPIMAFLVGTLVLNLMEFVK